LPFDEVEVLSVFALARSGGDHSVVGTALQVVDGSHGIFKNLGQTVLHGHDPSILSAFGLQAIDPLDLGQNAIPPSLRHVFKVAKLEKQYGLTFPEWTQKPGNPRATWI